MGKAPGTDSAKSARHGASQGDPKRPEAETTPKDETQLMKQWAEEEERPRTRARANRGHSVSKGGSSKGGIILAGDEREPWRSEVAAGLLLTAHSA